VLELRGDLAIDTLRSHLGLAKLLPSMELSSWDRRSHCFHAQNSLCDSRFNILLLTVSLLPFFPTVHTSQDASKTPSKPCSKPM
jgi:hypothetical protein